MLPKNQFEIAYRLDCRNLCADFQEDIQFRFSFGITALMERFLGPKGVRTVLTGKGNTVSLGWEKNPHISSTVTSNMTIFFYSRWILFGVWF